MYRMLRRDQDIVSGDSRMHDDSLLPCADGPLPSHVSFLHIDASSAEDSGQGSTTPDRTFAPAANADSILIHGRPPELAFTAPCTSVSFAPLIAISNTSFDEP